MGDINCEEILKGLSNMEGSDGYVVYNAEGIFKFLKLGIPLKYHRVPSHERAVHMAALF